MTGTTASLFCVLDSTYVHAAVGELALATHVPTRSSKLISHSAARQDPLLKVSAFLMKHNRKILVTGGAGFIGSNFIQLAVSAGDEVVNVDLLTYAGNAKNLAKLKDNPRYALVQADICDGDALAGAYSRSTGRPQSCISRRRVTWTGPLLRRTHLSAPTCRGRLHLLEQARQYWSSLSEGGRGAFRFLHVSTDEVYGSLGAGDAGFTEQTPYAPNSPYAASKAASDHLVRAYHHTYGLPTLTTNCSNNYGPLQFPEKLIPLMILNALEGKPLPVYGDGGNVRDWLYVGDHCAAIRVVLERGRTGETYNIGGNSERDNLTVVQTICRLVDEMRPDAAIGNAQQADPLCAGPAGHDRRYAIDAGKIARELGWRPAEAIRRRPAADRGVVSGKRRLGGRRAQRSVPGVDPPELRREDGRR